ncbi:MAG: hypothetical protein RLZZ28_2580, partial [Bacteroidota bacterium]
MENNKGFKKAGSNDKFWTGI